MGEYWTVKAADTPTNVLFCANLLARYVVWLMTSYLTDVWKMKLANAAAIVNVQDGMIGILPIAMAFLQDECFGQYRTALLSSLAYAIGLGFLTLSAPPVLSDAVGTCKNYEPACIGNVQKGLFYTAIALIVIGASGHSISLPSTWTNKKFSVIVPLITGTLATVIALPYVKSWAARFAVPAIIMVLATIFFWIGSCPYSPDQPRGSPLTRVLRVLVASSRKGHLHYSPKVEMYEKDKPEDDEIFCTRTQGYRWLNKAAMIESIGNKEQEVENKWRLCTITEVEETKVVLRLIPLWMTFIVCGLVMSIGSTYFLEQGDNMNRKLGKLKVPLPFLLLLSEISKKQAVVYYTSLSQNKRIKKYAPAIAISIGLFCAVLCCMTAALVEKKRLNVVRKHGLSDKPKDSIPMSMFWLVFQFVFLGILTGLSRVGIKGFFRDQIPDSMKAYIATFSDGIIGAGTTLSVLLVYVTGKISSRGGGTSWFGQTLNDSRLDYFYWTLAVFSCINLVFFVLVAIRYNFKEVKDEVVSELDEEQPSLDE